MVKSFVICILSFICHLTFGFCHLAIAQDIKLEPIVVNGDSVEYGTDNKEVSASGKVEVIYKGAKLTCDKLTVNTQTKQGTAQGHARLEDEEGVIEGSKIIYNFQTKSGFILDAKFRANPYFGKAEKVEKVSDNEFAAFNGYATTCNLDHPHFRIGSKEIRMFPQDKIQTKNNAFYLFNTPVAYLPEFNHSLKEKTLHVQVTPGSKKEWGQFLMGAWRYNLTDNLNGKIFLDYRRKLGLGQGLGLNFSSPNFGKGDYKFYYTKERPDNLPENAPKDFQRYISRFRHKWDIDSRTNVVSEYYHIADERRKFDLTKNVLKDYFPREYELDSQPLTYILLHHNFNHASADVIFQKRTNHFFDQLEELPLLKYSQPTLQIGSSPFFFEQNSSFATFNKRATAEEPVSDEVNVTRLDAVNKLSMPMKLSILRVTPFVGDRQTIYDRGANGAELPVRTIFSSGIDLSTKFFRLFNFKSDMLGMEINGLRHVITPSVAYSYNHTPTIPANNIRQIDWVDSLGPGNSANLSLSNKLQTKRNGLSVDFVDFLVSTTYEFIPKTGDKLGSNFSDISYELKLLPYSWLRIDADAIYKHTGNRSDPAYGRFSNLNYDFNFDWGKDSSFGIGQRYQRKAGNELVFNVAHRISPKWKFSVYNRYEFGKEPDSELERGIREQEYTLSRDLHCWLMDITLNIKKSEGSTLWFIFRLKAFPETEFDIQQSYRKPKSGSSSNP
jgi:lipopolysaccharide assembly outer membrane protein LptD (OstA)